MFALSVKLTANGPRVGDVALCCPESFRGGKAILLTRCYSHCFYSASPLSMSVILLTSFKASA